MMAEGPTCQLQTSAVHHHKETQELSENQKFEQKLRYLEKLLKKIELETSRIKRRQLHLVQEATAADFLTAEQLETYQKQLRPTLSAFCPEMEEVRNHFQIKLEEQQEKFREDLETLEESYQKKPVATYSSYQGCALLGVGLVVGFLAARSGNS